MDEEELAPDERADEDLTDDEGRMLMMEALSDLHELADSEENEVLADILFWILTHTQWLADDDGPYDGFLLLLIRNLLILGELEEAIDARTHLDPEVVANHPIMRAEHALHDIYVAQHAGDDVALNRAVRAAVEPVSLSDEPSHHEMLRNALAGLGPLATDVRSELRERVGRDLGTDPESHANERMLAAIAAVGRGEATLQLEEELVALARELSAADRLDRAASILLMAAQVAVHRNDARRAASHAGAGRQLLCTRTATAQLPVRIYLDAVYAGMLRVLGRVQLADQILTSLRGAMRGRKGLLAGFVHLVSGSVQATSDPWASLHAGLLAHHSFIEFRATLPTVGERSQLDEMVSAASELALTAAERTHDPAILAEVIEIVRMQGLPGHGASTGHAEGVVGASTTASATPLWMLVDVLGIPATKPAWRVQHEHQPAILTGPRPQPRMPWGGSAVSALVSRGENTGQIVDIVVPR